MQIKQELQTNLHRELATPEWLAILQAHLVAAIEATDKFRSAKGSAVVTSRYNEERCMGPLSLVKYKFLVHAEVNRGLLDFRKDSYRADVIYHTEAKEFETIQEVIETVETRARDKRYFALISKMIKRLNTNCPISEVDQFRCPWCEAPVRIYFHPEGNAFALSCSLDTTHFHRTESTDSPPSWWTERISGGWIK